MCELDSRAVGSLRFLAPLRGAVGGLNVNQGLRSLHSLNPWLISLHASGVRRATVKGTDLRACERQPGGLQGC